MSAHILPFYVLDDFRRLAGRRLEILEGNISERDTRQEDFAAFNYIAELLIALDARNRRAFGAGRVGLQKIDCNARTRANFVSTDGFASLAIFTRLQISWRMQTKLL